MGVLEEEELLQRWSTCNVLTLMSTAPLGCAGWELAVVGVWEGGAGDGGVLCVLHRELHGAELRQEAAAAETLGGEDQVMLRVQTHDWRDVAHWTRVATATGPTAPPQRLQWVSRQLNNKPHPSTML